MPPWLALILTLIGAGILLVLATAWLMARSLLRPPRMTDAKANWVLKRLTPLDLGLAYDTLSFTVRDEATGKSLSLAAWWIPHGAAAGKCAVLMHGYADAKVGAIAWAPMFHELGWNVLAVDLRAHGESGGDFTTAGYYERHDLNQVINRLRIDRPDQTRRMVLFGASMGAAVVAATAEQRDDLAAVILDSPFGDFRHAAMAHFDLMGAPGRLVQRLALRLTRQMTGARFEEVSPSDVIERVRCPLLMIASERDPLVSPTDEVKLRVAVGTRDYWFAEGVEHLMAVVQRPDEYRDRVARFLEKAVAAAYKPES